MYRLALGGSLRYARAMTGERNDKTMLQLLSERRTSTVIIGAADEIMSLDRLDRGVYRETARYDDVWQYAGAVPADVPEAYGREANALALIDKTDHWYESSLRTLTSIVGYLGLELALRFTQNGARFSTLRSAGNGIHDSERFLAVTPSIYLSITDAYAAIDHRYGKVLQVDSW